MNIIPIIAKADTIAKNELHKFKSKIMSELVSNGVQIYQFPTDEETVAEINATMSVSPQVRKNLPEIVLKAFLGSSSFSCSRVTGALGQESDSLALPSSASMASHLTTLLLRVSIYQMGKLDKPISSFLPAPTGRISTADLLGRECQPSTISHKAA